MVLLTLQIRAIATAMSIYQFVSDPKQLRENISSRVSRNSEAFALEFLDNLE